MVVKSAELETVCGITSSLPDNQWPEIAFAGKSNVGKSSLINGLLNRKALLKEMDAFKSAFNCLYTCILNDDREGMRKMMRCSTERRAGFDKPAAKPQTESEKEVE